MILADTSVWIDHLRRGNDVLAAQLDAVNVAIHPFIVGELACGNLRRRGELIPLLERLPHVPVASHAEAMEFIESRRLMGRGIGYVDVHLLASAALAGGVSLWTLDSRLAGVALRLRGDR